MGIPCFLLILFLSFHPSSSSPDLIQQTCRTTKHYDLCVSSLLSDSSSPQADTKGLALIMLRLGVANSTATTSYLSSQITTNQTDAANKLTKECSSRYTFASEALQNAVQDLSDEMYDYAYIHVMAAADYPNSCHNAFKRYPRLVYPKEIATREDGLKCICDVVLGIIDGLAF